MKRIFFLLSILILSAALFFSCAHGSIKLPDTPTYEELAVLEEMNFARTKPKEYIEQRLVPLRNDYNEKPLDYQTKLAALEELISEMEKMKARKPYEWGEGLFKAAASWVIRQGSTDAIGHDKDVWDRIKLYCSYSGVAENISYGYNNDKAKNVVIQLLVDDGVEGRGHRKNILSPSLTHAGAAIGEHQKYSYMCCIDFASGYKELEEEQ